MSQDTAHLGVYLLWAPETMHSATAGWSVLQMVIRSCWWTAFDSSASLLIFCLLLYQGYSGQSADPGLPLCPITLPAPTLLFWFTDTVAVTLLLAFVNFVLPFSSDLSVAWVFIYLFKRFLLYWGIAD